MTTDTLRAAGRVERYHTCPTVQRQTVAEHTWQIMRIWLEIYGPPSPEVTVAILLDDVGEIKTGDLPHNVKRDHPALKEIVTRVEKDHVRELLRVHCKRETLNALPIITSWQSLCIKMCELIEMAEFALDERLLGNMNSLLIRKNIVLAFSSLVRELSKGDSQHEDVQLAFGRLNVIIKHPIWSQT